MKPLTEFRQARSTPPRRRASGFSALELLVVMTVMGIAVAIASPGVTDFYLRYQLDAATTKIQALVQDVRMRALKEKVRYRLVFYSATDNPANRLEVQKEVGGTFVTLQGGMHRLSDIVRIANTSATDVVVDERGQCVTSRVDLYLDNGSTTGIKIQPTCASFTD